MKLGMLGHTCYAETISVYGTNLFSPMAMIPRGQKGFSRHPCVSRLKNALYFRLRLRSTDGYAEGKSMLYLEARCIYITKPQAFRVCRMVR